MEKKKKVLVMGLTSINNFGDNFITDCVNYLVSQHSDIESEQATLEPKMSLVTKFPYYFLLCLSKIVPKGKLADQLVYQAVKVRCKRNYRKLLDGKSALIYGCGSFKYGTQKLWAYYCLGIEIAHQMGIPVMFNAMNVQSYKENDWKCQMLTQHANYSNVKSITSRDGQAGVDKLRKNYGINEQIVCKGVGDAAFWIPECYGVAKRPEADVLGVNLIYGDIFVRYGGTISEEELRSVYCGILKKLDSEHIKWELFTNGLDADYQFGVKLLALYGEPERVIRHPSSTIDLLEIISSYKVVFGARLHACICSYALQIPVVGFYWDEKLVHFAHMAGIEDCFLSENELSIDRVTRILEEIYHNGYQLDAANFEYWKDQTKIWLDSFLK